MKKPDIIGPKVKFGWREVAVFTGVINRHNRRRYRKLSQLGQLTLDQLPRYLQRYWNVETGECTALR